MILDSVKNKIQRNSLLSLLTFIITGTHSAAGYAFVPKDAAEKLHKAEPTFLLLDPSVTNAEGQIKAVATQAAIDAVAGHAAEPKQESAAPTGVKPTYEFVTLTAIPDIMRGGKKSDSYNFESLKPFPEEPHAFLVPATESKPNPAKTLASTVASANKKYAPKVFTVRKSVKDDKVLGALVIRVK